MMFSFARCRVFAGVGSGSVDIEGLAYRAAETGEMLGHAHLTSSWTVTAEHVASQGN